MGVYLYSSGCTAPVYPADQNGALYIKLNIYICINIQHQMWTKTAGALVFQDRALCSVPTSLHPNPDSSLGTDPAFAMMVL